MRNAITAFSVPEKVNIDLKSAEGTRPQALDFKSGERSSLWLRA